MSATAVLFDMDGVLVDSEDYWVSIEREEILPAVVPHTSVDVAETAGLNYRESYDLLEDRYGTAVSRSECFERYHEAASEIYGERVALLEGVTELLEDLRIQNVPTAIVSASPHDWIEIVLDRFDLWADFDAVVSVEDIDGPGKPEPDVYAFAAGTLGVPIRSCLAVEDSEHGIEAASRAGASVLAYRIDAHDGPDLSAADAVVDDPAALRQTVTEQVAP